MNYSLELDPEAEEQLDALLRWQLEHLGEACARKASTAFEEVFDQIIEHPTRFQRIESNVQRREYRLARAFFHRVLYRVLEVDNEIRVLAIRHDREPLDRILGLVP